MSKKVKLDKLLVVRLPAPLFDGFKDVCNSQYKTMSEAIRDFIRETIKNEKTK